MKEFFLPFPSLSLSRSLINYFPILSLSLFTFFTFLLWPTLSIHAEAVNERSSYILKKYVRHHMYSWWDTKKMLITQRWKGERERERERKKMCGVCICVFALRLREYACERLYTCVCIGERRERLCVRVPHTEEECVGICVIYWRMFVWVWGCGHICSGR